jgi:hypothetical protein
MSNSRRATALTIAFVAAIPSVALGQARKVRVVSTDSVPIVYAYVKVEGGIGQITDEKGEVSVGTGKAKTFNATVRRIGYQPWAGRLEFPDTAAVITVTLRRVAQTLGEVRVTTREKTAPSLKGFYDRWTMRQKGSLRAKFMGPEEIELRNPAKISDMLSGLNGVQLRRMVDGDVVAFGMNNQCVFAIMIDGQRQCPASGCHFNGGGNATQIMGRSNPTFDLVPINQYLDADNVAGIEVYTRGGNMPASLQVSDQGWGGVAFWPGRGGRERDERHGRHHRDDSGVVSCGRCALRGGTSRSLQAMTSSRC